MGTVPAHVREGSENDKSPRRPSSRGRLWYRAGAWEGLNGPKSKKPFYWELVGLSASSLFSECIFARLAGVYRETFIIVSDDPHKIQVTWSYKCILYSNVMTPCPILRQEEKFTFISKRTHQVKHSPNGREPEGSEGNRFLCSARIIFGAWGMSRGDKGEPEWGHMGSHNGVMAGVIYGRAAMRYNSWSHVGQSREGRQDTLTLIPEAEEEMKIDGFRHWRKEIWLNMSDKIFRIELGFKRKTNWHFARF